MSEKQALSFCLEQVVYWFDVLLFDWFDFFLESLSIPQLCWVSALQEYNKEKSNIWMDTFVKLPSLHPN